MHPIKECKGCCHIFTPSCLLQMSVILKSSKRYFSRSLHRQINQPNPNSTKMLFFLPSKPTQHHTLLYCILKPPISYPTSLPTNDLHTSLQHLPQHPPERPILQRRSHPLLIPQLLTHLLGRTMRARFDPDVNPEPWRERLF